jgi:hypothetical protein
MKPDETEAPIRQSFLSRKELKKMSPEALCPDGNGLPYGVAGMSAGPVTRRELHARRRADIKYWSAQGWDAQSIARYLEHWESFGY